MIRGRRLDPVAAVLFAVGALSLVLVSRLNFRKVDGNYDLLNYHAYVPSALFNGTLFSDVHPAWIQSYLTPYQDLLMWPLISGVPAPIATAVIVAIQVSIFVPLGLILQTVIPALSRPRALAVGLIAVSGTMTMAELGGTMGDIPPAIPVAWALYLLLSVLAGQTSRPEHRAVLAGVLVGVAVALKYTVVYIAPGLFAVAVILVIAGKWRSASLFLVSSSLATIVLCAPWALVLQDNMGSPVFPLYNAIFNAPRYPPVNFNDDRFAVKSMAGLIGLPISQGLGTANTAEIPFRDVRWVIAFVAAGLGIVVAALRSLRPAVRQRWRAGLPGLALVMFWGISYVVWAVLFGVQRYAVPLEVLALPVIVTGAYLALPWLIKRRASLLILVLLAAFLARTTSIVDFGRRPMSWAPMVPAQTIEPLTRYGAIVIGEGPLGVLKAVTRDAPGASGQVWLDPAFDGADLAVEMKAIAGRSVGVLFYTDRHDTAVGAAASLGLVLTDDCATFNSPLENSDLLTLVEVCSATRSP